MARGFEATLGTASTDKVVGALTSDPAQRSYFIRFNCRSTATSGGIGRIFSKGSALYEFQLNVTVLQFQHQFSGALGGWTIALPTTGVWHTLGIKFDNGSASNDPTIVYDGSVLTVGSGITETGTPSGTANASANAFTLGNRLDNIRCFDGMLADWAVWDALLDNSEFQSLHAGFSPALIRPASLVEFIPMVRDNVNLKGAAPTITGALVQPHARVIGAR